MRQRQREKPASRPPKKQRLQYAAETNVSGLAGLRGIQNPMSAVSAVVLKPTKMETTVGKIQKRSGDRLLQQGRNNIGQSLKPAKVVPKPRQSSAPRDAPSRPWSADPIPRPWASTSRSADPIPRPWTKSASAPRERPGSRKRANFHYRVNLNALPNRNVHACRSQM